LQQPEVIATLPHQASSSSALTLSNDTEPYGNGCHRERADCYASRIEGFAMIRELSDRFDSRENVGR